jgi:hypothetical protein
MGKTVKKVATVAAIGAAAFYGGQALAAQFAGGAVGAGGGITHLGAAGLASGMHGTGVAAAGVGGGLFGSGLVSKVGLGLQGVSYMQQRKSLKAQQSATKQAAEEQRRINLMQERVRLVQERRQRLDILRQQRIQQGRMETEMGGSGLGLAGTSGFTGATSSIQTQATANLGAIDMASGASTAISRASQTAADYQTQASLAQGRQSMYKSMGGFGDFLSSNAGEIGNIFKIKPF